MACRPDLAHAWNGGAVSACGLALAALALTANAFGTIPMEIARFMLATGQRFGGGTWVHLASSWAGYMMIVVPTWMQMKHVPAGLDNIPGRPLDALGVDRAITVQGYVTGYSMLLGIKRVETRHFRMGMGWWNLHVGAAGTPQPVIDVAERQGMKAIINTGPRSVVVGRLVHC